MNNINILYEYYYILYSNECDYSYLTFKKLNMWHIKLIKKS